MKNLESRLKKNFSQITNRVLMVCMLLGLGAAAVQAQIPLDPRSSLYMKVGDSITTEITVVPGESFVVTLGWSTADSTDGATMTLLWDPQYMAAIEGPTDIIGSIMQFPLGDMIVNNETGYATWSKIAFGSMILPNFVDGVPVYTSRDLWSYTFEISEDVIYNTTTELTFDVAPGAYRTALSSYGTNVLDYDSVPSLTIHINTGVDNWDCPDLQANIGDPCDDGNPDTENDMVTDACACAGTPIVIAGCTNDEANQYPSSAIVPNAQGDSTNISGCSYFEEYSQITNISTGYEYEFEGVDDATGNFAFITVHVGTFDGPIIGAGISPLTVTATSNADLFVHWTADAECTTTDDCSNTAVTCITCATIPDCEGVPGGPAFPGAACDDGDPGTVGEVYQDDCSCAGGIPVAVNDEATSATALACGDTIVQSLVGATASLVDECNGSGSADVWFTFTTDGSQIVTVGEGGGDYFDAVVQLFQMDDLGNLVEVGPCADGPESFDVTDAGTYLFRVRPYFSSSDEAIISVYLNCEAYDCPELQANIGDACDDGNPETLADAINENCGCEGVLPGPGASCADAIAVECNADSVTYSSVGSIATNTTDCSMGDNGLWFTFVGNGGDITVNTSASFDHEVSINYGSCDTLINVECDDSSVDEESYTIEASLAGETYYVYIARYNNGSSITGDITIDIDCAGPPACDAPLLTLTLQDAAGAPIEDCVESGSSYYVLVSLEGGSGNDSYTVLANGSDSTNVPADGSHVFGPFTAGSDVDISAVGVDDPQCGAEGSIDSPAICPPSNDDCADAIAFELGDAGIIGYNTGATPDGPAMLCAFLGDEIQHDVWFSFVAPENGNLTIETSEVDGSDFSDTQIQILDGCGGNSIGCNEDQSNPFSLSSRIVLECGEYIPGQTYLVQVDGFSGDNGTFKLSVTADDAICFDCPELEANIGDACDDGNPDTGNDVVTENCGCEGDAVEPIFDCPELEANIGDSCDDANPDTENDVVTESCGCAGTPVDTTGCQNFVYYLADHAASDGISSIYEVTLSGGNANLSLIAVSDIEVHIAYNAINNLIYAVSKHNNSYRTIDPTDGSFGPVQSLGADYGQLVSAVFNHDGKLLIGSQDNNMIYSVNVSTNVVSVYDTYSPLYGGDLAFASDGMLYLATRTGSGLYENWPALTMADQLIGSVPDNVTGMAITDSDQLLISSRDHTSLEVRNTDGSDPGVSYPVMLNGAPYTLRDGDMASGCNSGILIEGDCDVFTTFYVNHGDGISGSNLYTVDFTVSGMALLTYVTNVAYEAHIAFNGLDNLLYFVNVDGSAIETYDMGSNTSLGSIPITSSASLSKVTAVNYNPDDGYLYIGDNYTNEIYKVDVLTGIATMDMAAPLSGGDLAAIGDGNRYLATRAGNSLYELTGAGPVFVGNIPAYVNGMTRWNDGSSLVLSNNATTEFTQINTADASVIATYTAMLNGSIFSLSNGDMASGCGVSDPVIVAGACYATDVVDHVQGVDFNGDPINPAQTDPEDALGAPEFATSGGNTYNSLGYGGSIILAFDGAVLNEAGADIEVIEATGVGYAEQCEDYPEYADIYVSVDGVSWFFTRTVCKFDGFVDISAAGDFDYINYVKIVNNDVMTSTIDAFDVDGVRAIHNCEDESLLMIESEATLTSFPNPTSGMSEVVFSASETGKTLIEVYDMNGRKVTTLFNKVAQADQEYHLNFDGQYLPNGVYIYRLTTNNETIIEKFMIAK